MNELSPQETNKISSDSLGDSPWGALVDYDPAQDGDRRPETSQGLDMSNNSVSEIITKGTLNGNEIGSDLVRRSFVQERSEDREMVARLVEGDVDSQRLAEIITDRGVCGFHGTDQSALAGILETGAMQSTRDLNESGSMVVSGEHLYQPNEAGQQTISFSNLGCVTTVEKYAGPVKYERYSHADSIKKRLDEANEISNLAEQFGGDSMLVKQLHNMSDRIRGMAKYIEESPESLISVMERTRFPVAIGVSRNFVKNSLETGVTSRSTIHSNTAKDLGEFRLSGSIPLKEIPLVLVPKEVVPWIKELLQYKGYGDSDIEVGSIDDLYATKG